MRLRSIEYKYLVAAIYVCGLFMDIMDSTIVNVALPTLVKDFHTTNNSIEWVVTGYLLSLAVWVPASGWVGDRFGTKKTFIFAMSVFTLGSALCGLSWNTGSLIAFRLLQGIGGGMMSPVGSAMLYRVFPPQERARASAFIAVPTMIAPAVGPIVGGWLVTDLSWRWIFYINLPVGLLGLTLAITCLREHREPAAGRLDIWGFVCSGAGLALILLGLSRGPEHGWLDPSVVGSLVAGVALFVALVVFELRNTAPMLDLRLFVDRMFRNANLFMFAASGGLIGVLFLLPLFLQELRGLSALQSGLATFPQAIGMILMVQLSTRMYMVVGPKRMMLAGMLGLAVTTALFLRIDLQTDIWWIRLIMFTRGLTLGFCMIPMQTAMFATIQPKDTGRASALMNANRQVGGSVGVAVLATIFSERTGAHVSSASLAAAQHGDRAARAAVAHGTLLAFHDAFAVAVVLAVIGAGFAFLIHDEDAAPTMHRQVPAGAREGELAPAAGD
ncbi:MAG TPA: MDR family MFS transporter [Dehalococcoidia bacterium]|nr:MDR family MFS transporter [Dehalococcoidia bacterium]